MYIKKIDYKKKELIVAIPLTTTTGKIRVKQRDNIYGYGLPFASRKYKFNQKNYIEWQIGIDIEVGKEHNEKLDIDLTTIKDKTFTAYNTKQKYLYELSEYLYYMVNFGIISINKIKNLKTFVEALKAKNLIKKHSHCQIKRTHPQREEINNLDFEILKVEYPQLIYRFKNYEIIAEITIREKQRAVGVQPMLYFCFPITELASDTPLIGRTAKLKEFAYFKFDKNNAFVILEMIKIFGMLSFSHQYDIIEILKLIIKHYKKLKKEFTEIEKQYLISLLKKDKIEEKEFNNDLGNIPFYKKIMKSKKGLVNKLLSNEPIQLTKYDRINIQSCINEELNNLLENKFFKEKKEAIDWLNISSNDFDLLQKIDILESILAKVDKKYKLRKYYKIFDFINSLKDCKKIILSKYNNSYFYKIQFVNKKHNIFKIELGSSLTLEYAKFHKSTKAEYSEDLKNHNVNMYSKKEALNEILKSGFVENQQNKNTFDFIIKILSEE